MALPDKPITRQEMYLSNMAGQGTPLPEAPITREEAYLDVIAKQGGGGGTGDGDMKKSVYDNNLAVLSAGGIKSFVAAQTAGKVDKVTGKGLSSNDYTDEEKTIVDGVADALSAKVDKVEGKGLSDNNYSDTDKAIVDGVTSALALKADKSEIPEKTSELTNDSGFITNTVNNLANYYLKSQTYTQAEVDALIAAVKNGRFISVATLPTTDIDTKAIYLVPSADPQTTNIKDEYINIDGTSAGWELIGSTAIDLSGYVTDAELTTALADYTTTANLTTLLAAKQDTISDLATIRSGASAGASAYQKPSTGIPKTDLASAVQTSLEKADSAVQDISGKADKVSNATNGNFAGLDANGNLTDSGKKASDFLSSNTPIPSIANCYQTGDTAETTLDDADTFPFYDTSATEKRKGLLSTLKAFLKTYFDGIYSTFSGSYNDLSDKPTIPDVSGKADITAIGTNETGSTASKAYAVGEHFYKNSKFCTCIQAIAQGAQFTLGTNYVEGTIAEHLKKPQKLLEITRSTNTSNMYEEIAQNIYIGDYDSLIIHVKLGSADVSLNVVEIENSYYKSQYFSGDSFAFYGMILLNNKYITKAFISSKWDSNQNYLLRVYGIKY